MQMLEAYNGEAGYRRNAQVRNPKSLQRGKQRDRPCQSRRSDTVGNVNLAEFHQQPCVEWKCDSALRAESSMLESGSTANFREKIQQKQDSLVECQALTGSISQLTGALAFILMVHCARARHKLSYSDPFWAEIEPEIELRDFLSRIAKRLQCSKSCFLLALIYIDRIVDINPEVFVNNMNVHRLVLTGILVASKFLDDGGFDNARYAEIGGMGTKEINQLELCFLKLINWNLHVRLSTYRWYCDHVSMAIAGA